MIEEVISDARYGLRMLRRNPVLAGAAIVTLALGIGANTAIFSVVNAVILRPLPYPHAERLVMLSEDNAEKAWIRQLAAPANYLDWKERVRSFEDAAAYTGGGGTTIITSGDPRRIQLRSVTGNYFDVLGVRPAFGRGFTPEETWKNGHAVAIISYRLWQDAFNGDRGVLGKTIAMDGTPTEIVGVMPASFTFAADSMDAWQPMGWDPQSRPQIFFRRAHWVRVIARLKPGLSIATADADFQTVVKQLQVEFPITNRVMGAELTPLHDFLIGDVKPALLMLQAAVALLLLIACANVGNLLLVQAVGREREASLRLTLGAGRARLVRQALTESLILSALGGVAGLALGWWGTKTLAALQPNGMLPVPNVHMDVRVLLGILALVTLTGLLFGIAPALWNARRVPAEVLKEGGRGGSGRLRRWGDILVVAEVALALTLTIGAGLLVRSFMVLQRVDPGFDVKGVIVAGIRLPAGYDSNATQYAFFDQLRAKVRALPDVEDAALAVVPPFGGVAFTSDYHVGGRPADEYGSEIAHDYVSDDYFRALHVQLRAGRFFNATDRAGSTPVTIINESLAKKSFAGQDPVGQRITFDKVPDSASVYRTIVGVVGDMRQFGLAVEPKIEAYESFSQQANDYMTLMAKSKSGDAAALVPQIRRVLHEMDSRIALAQTYPLERLRERSIARQRFVMLLLAVFATTGFLLAVVGVYGVMAQLARRRTREMGIRLALGARTVDVQWLVVRHGLTLVTAGLVIGIATSFGASQAIRSLLYDVAPTDPLTFASVPLLLIATGLVATWLPALRASRTNPASTLREE